MYDPEAMVKVKLLCQIEARIRCVASTSKACPVDVDTRYESPIPWLRDLMARDAWNLGHQLFLDIFTCNGQHMARAR